MSPRFDLLLMIPCVGFAVLGAAWLALALATDLRARALFGIMGSLLAGLLFGVLWQADRFPWLWEAGGVKAMPLLWLGAAVLHGFALLSGHGRSRGVMATAIALGVLGFLLLAFGAFVFLWMAALGV